MNKRTYKPYFCDFIMERQYQEFRREGYTQREAAKKVKRMHYECGYITKEEAGIK